MEWPDFKGYDTWYPASLLLGMGENWMHELTTGSITYGTLSTVTANRPVWR